MKSHHTMMISTVALLLSFALSVPIAQAQLPPPGKTVIMKKGGPGPQVGQAEWKNGMTVRVNKKDNTSVLGTVVYDAGDYLLLRLKPGASPITITAKEIDPVKSIQRIKFVNFQDEQLADEPEIHKVTMDNGVKSVKYFAPTLSAGEKSTLADLEIAENASLRVEYMLAQAIQALREETLSAKRRNQMMGTELYWLSAGVRVYPTYGYYAYPVYGTGYAASAPRMAETVLTKEITLGNQLAKLRRELAQMQRSHGLYEDGRLVAVLADKK
jgi:endoglucanase Acf2